MPTCIKHEQPYKQQCYWCALEQLNLKQKSTKKMKYAFERISPITKKLRVIEIEIPEHMQSTLTQVPDTTALNLYDKDVLELRKPDSISFSDWSFIQTGNTLEDLEQDESPRDGEDRYHK